jgi:hypothetical protein
MGDKKIRIGCASAFYGDSQLAARQLVDKGDIEYLVFDYLAEVTMAILSRAKMKNENYGYAVDFVTVAMRDVLADCAKKGIKVIANAGGVNVPSCISALEALCEELNISLNIAGVYGDNLAPKSAELDHLAMSETQTGAALPDRLASINAYLGARPIADALAAGADVVVTGRVVDSAVMLAPLMHEFNWQQDEYDKLSQGSLVGHVLECGAQCSGGNFTDWHLVPDFADISYPIAEVSEDGSFVVTIAPGTGGMVSVATVAEQIVYEIGDPSNYLLPDVFCDWSQVQLKQLGKDQVRVSHARGRAPANNYKVCATYVDGYRLMGSFYIAGPRVADKARVSLDAWVRRTEKALAAKGLPAYRQVSIEVVGAEDTYGPHGEANKTREAMAKYGVHHDSRDALNFAAAELAYLATSGTPGMASFGPGRAKPQPLMRVHSTVINKADVPVTVQLGSETITECCYQTAEQSDPADAGVIMLTPEQQAAAIPQPDWQEVSLETLVYARSGDKGDNANIGVIARRPEYIGILQQQLTAQAIADYFAHTIKGGVTRFEIPGFNALNFLLTEALGGGGTASVQIDAQGKTLAQMLLSMTVRVPPTLLP